MKDLIKKSKQNSLLGGRIRRMFKIKGMAIAILFIACGLFVGAMYTSGDIELQAIGAICMAAPLVFSVPADLGLTDKEQKGIEALATHFNKQFEQYESGLVSREDMQNSMKGAFDGYMKEFGFSKERFAELESTLKEQGMQIKVLKDTGRKESGNMLSDICKELFTKENVDELLAAKGALVKKSVTSKAATTTMVGTNVEPNAPHALSFEVLPGINYKPIAPPRILERLTKGMTNSRTLIWINQIDKDGAAAFVAEGELKPLMDWEYKEEVSVASKIAVRGKISKEILRDFSIVNFQTEVRRILTRNLYKELDEQILNGDGIYPNPLGISLVAGGYVGSGLDGTIRLPNNADAIRAGMLQMNLLEYTPDVVFMNPTDLAMIELEKTTDGNYIRVQVENVIRGLEVISTSRIPAGYFLLMDSNEWDIRILDDFELSFGWENDDYTRNLVSVIAELSLHSLHNSIHEGAMMYEEFATIKTAIEAP